MAREVMVFSNRLRIHNGNREFLSVVSRSPSFLARLCVLNAGSCSRHPRSFVSADVLCTARNGDVRHVHQRLVRNVLF